MVYYTVVFKNQCYFVKNFQSLRQLYFDIHNNNKTKYLLKINPLEVSVVEKNILFSTLSRWKWILSCIICPVYCTAGLADCQK